MKNIIKFFLAFICVMNLYCSNKNEYYNFFGERIQGELTVKERYMISSGSFVEGYQFKYKEYIFFMIPDSSKNIVYASTNDQKFMLDNRFFVGKKYSSIKSNLIQEGYYQSGWAYVIPLKENWKLAFFDEAVLKNGKPSDTSVIKFIFRSK